jgi:drug/metabolite transporter (DMT)-like permease
MWWVFLAILGACTNATYFIANKKFLQRINAFQLAGGSFLCSGLFLLILSFSTGIPVIGNQFIIAVVASTLLNIVATTLIFRALSSSDISLAMPMLSFTPLFLVVTSAVILHEFPSAVGIAGILIIVTGSYVLNTTAEHQHILDPFRAMISHPGVLAMLGVAFIFAIAVNFDKMIVLNSDPVFGSCIEFLLLGSAFVLMSLMKTGSSVPFFCKLLRKTPPNSPDLPVIWQWSLLIPFVFIGSIVTIEAVAINLAYTLQIVPYVIAIKRMSIILMVVYGVFVFKEKELLRRCAGASLMVFGAILILLFP